MVLLLVWILALLGDNPMQSEMSCHRGLLAKFFCRCCWVKGLDAVSDPGLGSRGDGTRVEASAAGVDAPGDSSEGAASVTASSESEGQGGHHTPRARGTKVVETMGAMVDRVRRFMMARDRGLFEFVFMCSAAGGQSDADYEGKDRVRDPGHLPGFLLQKTGGVLQASGWEGRQAEGAWMRQLRVCPVM
ncbi:hypothetical protein JB92DRAFT_1757084 [Gautieria morchelliformis]|nr:hypothetical protein JB92DRAFT_1757084 [Gautieria morchelliformis]